LASQPGSDAGDFRKQLNSLDNFGMRATPWDHRAGLRAEKPIARRFTIEGNQVEARDSDRQ
jgi:hypothetical protein